MHAHTQKYLADFEAGLKKMHEAVLDMLHAVGKLHANEIEFAHAVDGMDALEPAPAPQPQPQLEPEVVEEPPAPAPAPEPEPEPESARLTYDQVRQAAATKANTNPQAGPQIMQLLQNLGVAKLSDLPEDKYPEFVAKVEAL